MADATAASYRPGLNSRLQDPRTDRDGGVVIGPFANGAVSCYPRREIRAILPPSIASSSSIRISIMRRPALRASAAFAAAALLLLCGASDGMARDAGVAKPWVLQKGREIAAPRQRKPMLNMEGQQLSGSTGCNTFTAALREGAGNKVAIEDVTLSRKLCGPAESKVEDAFVRALADTQHLRKERTRLTFLSGKQEVLLVWARGGKSSARQRSARRSGAYRARRAPRGELARWCGRR